ncbi:60S ribosomal protein L18a-like [Gossypium australe]|uniref:60S ribosomal protein L18a-like n=12 Tax=Gossypium TaxID=3633 RepID=A0A5B6WBS0_9ROSI|nr:60S ribosomal protein L18a-like [Gossypium australe]
MVKSLPSMRYILSVIPLIIHSVSSDLLWDIIFEKSPTKIKNYGIWLRYQSRTGYHNMYKEYRDTTLNGAVEQMYTEMASRHRVRFPCIQIIKTATIPAKLCKRDSTKQFHNSKIKFPLVFKKVRPPTRKLKTTYKASKPNLFMVFVSQRQLGYALVKEFDGESFFGDLNLVTVTVLVMNSFNVVVNGDGSGDIEVSLAVFIETGWLRNTKKADEKPDAEIRETGEKAVLAINEIFEKNPTKIKNYGIWLRYQSRTGYHNMYKEYRDTTLNGAVEQMYTEMASRHRVRFPCIQIIKTATIPAKLCKRDSTKQFHNSKIKFPLVFKKVRPPTRKLKTTYKASKPNLFM